MMVREGVDLEEAEVVGADLDSVAEKMVIAVVSEVVEEAVDGVEASTGVVVVVVAVAADLEEAVEVTTIIEDRGTEMMAVGVAVVLESHLAMVMHLVDVVAVGSGVAGTLLGAKIMEINRLTHQHHQ